MTISFKTENEELVCIFSGRMDTVNCMEVKKDVKEKVDNHNGKVIFDMEEVDYISSSFLRICAQVATTIKKENFSIVKIKPIIKKVFMIAGLTNKLNIS
jgi:anti-anti-sigma factor